MKHFLLLVCMMPLAAFASIAGEVTVGDRTVTHDSFYAGLDGSGTYYQEGQLVASIHDTDGDDKTDVWLVYENELVVLEGHDTTRDGVPDAFVEFDSTGAVITVIDGPEAWEKPEIVAFTDLVQAIEDRDVLSGTSDDLVGSLDSIKVPGAGIPKTTIFFWIVLLGAGYWWYKKKYQVKK